MTVLAGVGPSVTRAKHGLKNPRVNSETGKTSCSANAHANPNDATYSTGSPISRATIHSQRDFLRSSLIPEFYRGCGNRGKANLRCDFRTT